MIRPGDAEFQFSPDSPLDWCETNFFPFAVPEERISGSFYLLSRPRLGVAMSDVSVQDRIAPAWEDQLYVDNQQHLPCPPSLLAYSLPNGLSVEAVEPLKRYRIDYAGIDDTEIHVEFAALMAPFDMNDPAMDPLAGPRIGKGWGGAAFSGHYEITGRITGEARLRGTSYAIDCVDTLDRSWGPRKERDNGNAIWLHGSFGEALTMHAFFGLDPANGEAFGPLISGYILEDGAVHGLVAGQGRASRLGTLPMSNAVEVTDIRGKTFHFTAAAVNAAPWAPFPSMLYSQSLMRWSHEGAVGWGIQQDVLSRAYMTRNRIAMRTS
jgi:hypothetical protein